MLSVITFIGTLSLLGAIIYAVATTYSVADDIMALQSDRYRTATDYITATPADWTDLHTERYYALTYTVIERSADERLCAMLAPVYAAILTGTGAAVACCHGLRTNITEHGIITSMLHLLTGEYMSIKGVIQQRVAEALETRLETMVEKELAAQIATLDLDTMVAAKLGVHFTTQQSAPSAQQNKSAPQSSKPDALYTRDSKGHVESILLADGTAIDCTGHRFQASPCQYTGAGCTMVQGTTRKPGTIIGDYSSDKYVCLTSKGGIVIRSKSATDTPADWNSASTEETKPKVSAPKTAMAAGYPVAAPDYRGTAPIAFLADGQLVKRGDTVVTVKSSSPKGAMWIANPSMIPRALVNGAKTIVPVVYS